MKKFKVGDLVLITAPPPGCEELTAYVGRLGIVTDAREVACDVVVKGLPYDFGYYVETLVEPPPEVLLAFKLGAYDETKTESV